MSTGAGAVSVHAHRLDGRPGGREPPFSGAPLRHRLRGQAANQEKGAEKPLPSRRPCVLVLGQLKVGTLPFIVINKKNGDRRVAFIDA